VRGLKKAEYSVERPITSRVTMRVLLLLTNMSSTPRVSSKDKSITWGVYYAPETKGSIVCPRNLENAPPTS
jgi:hypothetical protein